MEEKGCDNEVEQIERGRTKWKDYTLSEKMIAVLCILSGSVIGFMIGIILGTALKHVIENG